MFDVGKRETFAHVASWVSELRRYADTNCVLCICGNHYRYNGVQALREVTIQEAEALAVEQDCDYAECDVNDVESVRRVFIAMVYRVLQSKPAPPAKVMGPL